MVLSGGATFAFSVIGYPSKYLWRRYASAFGPEPQWAETADAVAETADVVAETAHAAAETPDALERGEAAAKMDYWKFEDLVALASNLEARCIPCAREW